MEFLTICILFMASLAWEVNCQNQENVTGIIQFPYDPENSNTFASIPITPTEEPFESLTLCLSFSMDALRDKFLDKMEIFQLVADRTSVACVVLQVSSIGFYSAAFHDQYGWIMDQKKFDLSAWIRMCYAIDQRNSTIVVNGAEGHDRRNNRGFNLHPAIRQNVGVLYN